MTGHTEKCMHTRTHAQHTPMPYCDPLPTQRTFNILSPACRPARLAGRRGTTLETHTHICSNRQYQPLNRSCPIPTLPPRTGAHSPRPLQPSGSLEALQVRSLSSLRRPARHDQNNSRYCTVLSCSVNTQCTHALTHAPCPFWVVERRRWVLGKESCRTLSRDEGGPPHAGCGGSRTCIEGSVRTATPPPDPTLGLD